MAVANRNESVSCENAHRKCISKRMKVSIIASAIYVGGWRHANGFAGLRSSSGTRGFAHTRAERMAPPRMPVMPGLVVGRRGYVPSWLLNAVRAARGACARALRMGGCTHTNGFQRLRCVLRRATTRALLLPHTPCNTRWTAHLLVCNARCSHAAPA